eukprot:scaffold5487_cov153-Skeletonema_marinoi.AAC.18
MQINMVAPGESNDMMSSESQLPPSCGKHNTSPYITVILVPWRRGCRSRQSSCCTIGVSAILMWSKAAGTLG